jgi:hypothetical protein
VFDSNTIINDCNAILFKNLKKFQFMGDDCFGICGSAIYYGKEAAGEAEETCGTPTNYDNSGRLPHYKNNSHRRLLWIRSVAVAFEMV